MEIVAGTSALARRPRHPVVAIGNFDGVHRGHQFIFAEARRLAADGEAVVLTFDPHPARLLAPTLAPPLITTPARKLGLIAASGVALAVVEPFTREFAALDPEAFVDQVLARGLGAVHVCVGHDFTFGARRAGTVDVLRALGERHGFQLTVVAPVTVDGLVCSSTKVREFVSEGRVDGAQVILGRPHEVEGVVIRGDGRGRTIGVPTANLELETELIPQTGVYAGWGESADGKRWPAAINVGSNPTFGAARPVRVEAHLLDAAVDLYGARLRVGFVARLRAEERFASKEALVAQIARDVERTRQIMGEAA